MDAAIDNTTAHQPINLGKVERALQISQQLWQQGSLGEQQAEQLLAILPMLRPLLQPIASKPIDSSTDTINAYCLTAPLLTTFAELSRKEEWQLVLLTMDTDIRQSWLNLAAARCQEAGLIIDPLVLINRIKELGNASEWVLDTLNANDTPLLITESPYATIERRLLGHSLNDNAAIPSLCRILRVGFNLYKLSQTKQTPVAIADIDISGKGIEKNWCEGRLLALPSKSVFRHQMQGILTDIAVQSDMTLNDQLCRQPWLFLLSLIVFVQDAWQAEQRGGLLLTLADGQNPMAPTQINVVLQGIEGEEVSLGSLAEFILRLLNEIGITLYPVTPDNSTLNRQLSPVIIELLNKKIWQFKESGSIEHSYYRIHHEFSDVCYKLPLAPLFGYRSSQLQHTIKQVAQTMSINKRI
jgi:hypothetical protein